MAATLTAPQVTVLMCVYNAEAYVRDAIDSILGQTFSDFEFLIINDASTDSSRDIIASFSDPRIRLIDNPTNSGLTRSLNRGLELARGELIARQDADDHSYPNRIALQVAFMKSNPDVCVVGTQARFISAHGRRKWVQGYEKAQSALALRWQLMFDSPFVHTSVMFRRAWVWEAEGGYDTNFVTSQDFELWSRLARRYKLANLPEHLVAMRLHRASVSMKYSRDNVARARDVMLRNVTWNLPEYPEAHEWVDVWWLGLVNHRLAKLDINGQVVLRHLNRIRQLFTAHYGQAAEDYEITAHTAGLMIRSAFILAMVGMPGSSVLIRGAAVLAPVRALLAMPLLMGYMLRRLLSRNV